MVLCLAMMLSIMVVGAGAAFADQDQIDTKHQEAVDACASLNIITGFANGKFVPNDNVTREQTAKMICVLLNGGKDPVLGAGSSSFSDVANDRWSCPYIESCVSQDIIVGIGGGKFAPAGKVTGSQLAKMLLVALGFSPDHQKYSGSAWEVNVNTDASARGFYKELEDINPSEPLTREHAAQMIWNALNAYEVEYKSVLSTDANGQLTSKTTVQDKVVGSNNDKITLLQDKYNVDIPKGILTSVEKTDGKETYSITVDNGRPINDVAKDYSDLLGQEVKVMIQAPEKKGEDSKVIGVYATDNNTVVTAQKGDMDDLDSNKATVNGETYKPDSSFKNMEAVPVYFTPGTVYAAGNASTVGAMADYQTLSLIDNDGDGKIDIAICTPVSFAQIKTLTSEDLTLKAIAGDDAIVTDPTTYDVDDGDITLYDGAAKDDYVVITAAKYTVDGTAVATKADMVTGNIDSTKTKTENNVTSITDVKTDGSWYTRVANDQTAGLKLNKTFDMATLGSYVFAADKNSGSATAEDILFVDVAAPLINGVAKKDGKIEAKVYFAEVGASSETITISEIYKAGADDSDKAQTFCTSTYATTKYANSVDADNIAAILEGKMWMFDKDGSDYILTELDSRNETLSFDGYAHASYATLEDGKTSGTATAIDGNAKDNMRVNDSSIVFVKAVKDGDSEVKVISGKTVAGWADRTDTDIAGLYDTEKGYNYIQVGAINLTNTSSVPGANDHLYGYVVAAPEFEKTNDGTFWTTTIWNGTEDLPITGKCQTANQAPFAKGDFIAYTLNSEGKVDKDTLVVATIEKNAEAITAYDDKSVNGYDYDDDAAKIGVNVKDTKGAEFTIDTADEVPNAVIFYVKDGKVYNNKDTKPDGCDIGGIFVASNNKMVKSTTSVNSTTVTYQNKTIAYNSDQNVSFTVEHATVDAGKDFVITATRTPTQWNTGSYKLTLKEVGGTATLTATASSSSGTVVFNVHTSASDAGKTFEPSSIVKAES